MGRAEPLSHVTARLAREAGVESRLLPATDDRLRTTVVTPAGRFSFQEWFVARRHADEVDAVELELAGPVPTPGVIEAIEDADLIVVGRSRRSFGPPWHVGSVAAFLTRHAGRPVLIAPPSI